MNPSHKFWNEAETTSVQFWTTIVNVTYSLNVSSRPFRAFSPMLSLHATKHRETLLVHFTKSGDPEVWITLWDILNIGRTHFEQNAKGVLRTSQEFARARRKGGVGGIPPRPRSASNAALRRTELRNGNFARTEGFQNTDKDWGLVFFRNLYLVINIWKNRVRKIFIP